MKVFSFSRMKSFRKSGRLSVIIKLTLPELRVTSEDGVLSGADVFNSFYISLAESYQIAAGKIEIDEYMLGQRPITISIGFEDITDEYLSRNSKLIKKCHQPIVVKRYARKNRNGEITVKENVDIFDLEMGIFIK